jgi:hypothetical protein
VFNRRSHEATKSNKQSNGSTLKIRTPSNFPKATGAFKSQNARNMTTIRILRTRRTMASPSSSPPNTSGFREFIEDGSIKLQHISGAINLQTS